MLVCARVNRVSYIYAPNATATSSVFDGGSGGRVNVDV